MFEAAQASFGQDITPDGLGLESARMLLRRLVLPKRKSGAGLRLTTVLAKSTAFVAGMLDTIPRLIDRTVGVSTA